MKVELLKNGEAYAALDSDGNTLYRDVAKYVCIDKQILPDSGERVYIDVNVDEGAVRYLITRRSGSQFITEVRNNLPDSFCHDEDARYLTCIDPERNAYKFYKLEYSGDHVNAYYGRMGVQKGERFGERRCEYPRTMFWCKYYEKLGKGYEDRSDIYIQTEDYVKAAVHEDEKKQPVVLKKTDTPSSKLFSLLNAFAKNAVREAKISVPITPAIIERSKELLNGIREADNTDALNKVVLELMATLQRPVRTGDGRGVKDLLANSMDDKFRIIQREDDLISAMEGVALGTRSANMDFTPFGIDVYEATKDQKDAVLRHLSDILKPKVDKVYRVIPHAQKARFDAYIKEHNISAVKQMWHGSRNENWMSIVQKSLMLNPDAVITGKMFGAGIYFAPSSLKSWNYTSYRGTTWASGHSDTGIMGLYAIGYGKPYDVYSHSSYTDYRRETINGGYDSLHAHKGSMLLNDEIVLYNEAAILLQYIVVFK